MRVKPFPKCPRNKPHKKRKGRSFDRPRNENTRYYLMRGYGPSRALRVPAHAGFVACGHVPKWIACIVTQLYSKASEREKQELRSKKTMNFDVMAEGGGVEPPSGSFPERWFSGPESVAVASRPPMEWEPGLEPGKNCFADSRLDRFGISHMAHPRGIEPRIAVLEAATVTVRSGA